MTKKELIEALSGVNDDAELIIGVKEPQFEGAMTNRIFVKSDELPNKQTVLITNNYFNKETPEYYDKIF